jgi:hypothetical protein
MATEVDREHLAKQLAASTCFMPACNMQPTNGADEVHLRIPGDWETLEVVRRIFHCAEHENEAWAQLARPGSIEAGLRFDRRTGEFKPTRFHAPLPSAPTPEEIAYSTCNATGCEAPSIGAHMEAIPIPEWRRPVGQESFELGHWVFFCSKHRDEAKASKCAPAQLVSNDVPAS